MGTNLWRLMLSIILKPVALDKSFTRTQEYTADRAGLYYAEEGALSMIYLFSGKYMGSRVDLEEYFHSIDLHDDTIWLKLSNFLSDHPVGFRRMQTLKKPKILAIGTFMGNFSSKSQPSLNKRAGTKDSLTFVPARYPPINEQILLW